jgi:hypothetical protein
MGKEEESPLFYWWLQEFDMPLSAATIKAFPMPEPDPRFNEFVILQAQNAGLFLGQIPNPQTGTTSVNLRAAKSVIDSLEMLASKTRGNLTASEEKLLTIAIQNLMPLYQSAQGT